MCVTSTHNVNGPMLHVQGSIYKVECMYFCVTFHVCVWEGGKNSVEPSITVESRRASKTMFVTSLTSNNCWTNTISPIVDNFLFSIAPSSSIHNVVNGFLIFATITCSHSMNHTYHSFVHPHSRMIETFEHGKHP